MMLSVVVPTYRRPEFLRRCLSALVADETGPDEIVVVVREDDELSQAVIYDVVDPEGRLRRATVAEPGFWNAVMAGLREATGDLVAFIDDDAAPMPGWANAICDGFSDQQVGAFGGRIMNFVSGRTSNCFVNLTFVARVDVLGRPQSELHDWPVRRVVRDVAFLPGSNMAFRREMVAPLADLEQVSPPAMAPGNEMVFALAVQSRGARVVFDSSLYVEHHPAPRAEVTRADRIAYAEGYAYCVAVGFPLRRPFALAASCAIGGRAAPGFLLLPLCLVKGSNATQRWRAAARGRLGGLRARRELLRTLRALP